MFLQSGKDYAVLTNMLGTTDAFNSQFSSLTSIDAQASKMISHLGLVKDGNPNSAGSIAHQFFVDSLQGGQNKASLLLDAALYLLTTARNSPSRPLQRTRERLVGDVSA